jgi:hypothetical protein
MRTIDVVDLDVEDMVRTAAQNGIDCLVVNAAGFTAWYPTRLPTQRPNPYMTGDFLGEVVWAAAKYNLLVYGRVDISKGFSDWYLLGIVRNLLYRPLCSNPQFADH